MMADDLVDDASETGSLLGVKKRSRVKNSWFDDEADDDDGEVGEQGGDEDDENTTGKQGWKKYRTTGVTGPLVPENVFEFPENISPRKKKIV